jgi:hypothetical protein
MENKLKTISEFLLENSKDKSDLRSLINDLIYKKQLILKTPMI